jgi:hypothetical protein
MSGVRFEQHSDLNAALDIRARAAVNLPKDSESAAAQTA